MTSTSLFNTNVNIHVQGEFPRLLVGQAQLSAYVVLGNVVDSPVAIFADTPFEKLARAAAAFNAIIEEQEESK